MMKHGKLIVFVLFCVAIYFPLFLHLDHNPLYRWDESRNAFNALEMLENGNYLRKFYLGTPDQWDTKPPLLIWLQAIHMKIFGYNELAVRLPSALAALASVLLIAWFFNKHLRDFWGGICSGLVLLTSSGYVRLHVSRTGDHDALLIFFLLMQVIFFYLYLFDTRKSARRNIIWFVVGVIGGILTKSVAGLFFTPGILLFTVLSGKLLTILQDRYFWFAVLSILLVVGGYYGLTEYWYPGYLRLVWDNELLPRFMNSSDMYSYNEMPEAYHFTKVLFQKDFKFYAWFLPISVVLLALAAKSKEKWFFGAVFLIALTFHFLISNGSYNAWYNAPLFPLLAILVGKSFSLIFHTIRKYFSLKHWKNDLFVGLSILGVFALPFTSILREQIYFNDNQVGYEKYGSFLHKLKEDRPDINELTIYSEIANAHILFYWTVYNKCYGYNISNCGTSTNVTSCPNHSKAFRGDYAMACSENIKQALQNNYKLIVIEQSKHCVLYQIKGEKIESDPEVQQ